MDAAYTNWEKSSVTRPVLDASKAENVSEHACKKTDMPMNSARDSVPVESGSKVVNTQSNAGPSSRKPACVNALCTSALSREPERSRS